MIASRFGHMMDPGDVFVADTLDVVAAVAVPV